MREFAHSLKRERKLKLKPVLRGRISAQQFFLSPDHTRGELRSIVSVYHDWQSVGGRDAHDFCRRVIHFNGELMFVAHSDRKQRALTPELLDDGISYYRLAAERYFEDRLIRPMGSSDCFMHVDEIFRVGLAS